MDVFFYVDIHRMGCSIHRGTQYRPPNTIGTPVKVDISWKPPYNTCMHHALRNALADFGMHKP